MSGYYVGYQQALYPPSEIEWAGLTHLMIGRVTPNPDGTLNTTFDISPTGGPPLARTLVQLAHENGKKAVVMLGGAGEHAGWVSAASASNRAVFVQNLLQLRADYGFDGFDLDWEPIEIADQPNFSALAEALRTAAPDAILTLPVGWVNANSPEVGSFYGEMAKLFDQINVMSYSMAGAWDGWQSWHSSALTGHSVSMPSSVESSVQAYLDAGVPAAKLGVGIGFYGSCWSPPVRGPGGAVAGSTVIADDNVMSFTNIMNGYYSAEFRTWDTAAQVPYLSFPVPFGTSGCTFVSYEDEQSIRAKGRFVRNHGLGGAIVWTINEGYLPDRPVGQRSPLLRALHEAFLQ
ncbi:glycoside hydrolase family 18 protein [Chondromyces crocatus]|uniref:glycoside hydrolase family 18 protein n=1 Tax=Chondromyces crocatus TaxID=52 RepID=UPI001470845C|nr:glycoside hydrolase family 18 protein [Chondromyces crocatus]